MSLPVNGRRTLFLLTGGWILLFGVLNLFLSYNQVWKLFNVRPMDQSFADIRVITGGIRSEAIGHDPLYVNPEDPWMRPFNYPRIWLALFRLSGIDEVHVGWIGLLFAILFGAGVYLFSANFDRLTAICTFVLILSPAVLTGIERGNTDLIIFFLLAGAIVVCQRSAILSTMIITLAGVLKFFPAFGLSLLWRQKPSVKLVLWSTAGFILILYAFFTLSDIVR